ncbi:hypothetical protein ACCO45_000005 [Purpureocillium lilacinum]|uniref:Uncharacterized protein n=1 Tax=Purpureocillium lilacinum TaxID=33203 RepID=A0ACC4EBK0_PURLI
MIYQHGLLYAAVSAILAPLWPISENGVSDLSSVLGKTTSQIDIKRDEIRGSDNLWLVAKGTLARSRADTGASSQRNREFRQRRRVSEGDDMSDWVILDGEDEFDGISIYDEAVEWVPSEQSGSQDTDTLDIADGDEWILMDADNEFDGMYIYDEAADWVPDSSSADFA